jgi:hypothetical protein
MTILAPAYNPCIVSSIYKKHLQNQPLLVHKAYKPLIGKKDNADRLRRYDISLRHGIRVFEIKERLIK